MRSIKRSLCLMMLFIASTINAQEDASQRGIQWTTGLTWQQVKEKAKIENKYIFLDCFATWCGPCKQMEKKVYINDTVGQLFNQKFISIKVQFDKTEKDNEDIKRWYDDVAILEKEYRVKGFPTYIFLSPQGLWVHNELGFQSVAEFINTAQIALQPDRVYVDPNEDFYKMAENYKENKKDFRQMPYMRKKALELDELDMANAVAHDYKQFLTGLSKEELYTRENLEFLASTYIAKTSPFFSLFYPNGRRADAVMNQNGFAARVVENTVNVEIVMPFYKHYGFVPARIFGSKVDSTEADWKALYQSIRKSFNREYAKRSLLDARINWYDTKQNDPAFLKYYFHYLELYGLDTSQVHRNSPYYASSINIYCWVRVFERATDKTTLEKATWIMRKLVMLTNECAYIDTYANLLYKLGKVREAIEWEEKALQGALEMKWDQQIEEYVKNLEKMKRGEPTWLGQVGKTAQ
ncbi:MULTISPECIES: thioredoxin family protein [Niastella]|uniref:DUF255 domain-containing protein n=1 Tax=Niastella soli TaxID=2821487 RepID=A0ABS3YTZ6_9BACT|nr:DUF255 domain-containing protein [Niastella soli]MBO9201406.1 DUF255 domain-containing protein [Niastella soli]